MAKSPTAQIHELALELQTALERIDTLVRDGTDAKLDHDDLRTLVERQRDELVVSRQENAVLRQRLDDHLKRVDTWAGRVWAVVPVLVGATLTLGSGLIVTLARK